MSVRNKYSVFVDDDNTVRWFDHDRAGRRHRLEGPAIEHSDGSVEYWIEGTKLSEAEFKSRTENHKIVIDGVEIEISHESYETLRTSLQIVPARLINVHTKSVGYSGLYLGTGIRTTADAARKKHASICAGTVCRTYMYDCRTYITIDRTKNELRISSARPSAPKTIPTCISPEATCVQRYISGREPFVLSQSYLSAIGFRRPDYATIGHTSDGTIVIRRATK